MNNDRILFSRSKLTNHWVILNCQLGLLEHIAGGFKTYRDAVCWAVTHGIGDASNLLHVLYTVEDHINE